MGRLSSASPDSGDSRTHLLPSCLGRISAAPAAMRRVILGRWWILGESSYVQIRASCLKCEMPPRWKCLAFVGGIIWRRRKKMHLSFWHPVDSVRDRDTGPCHPHVSVFLGVCKSWKDLCCCSSQGYHVLHAQSSGEKCAELRELPGPPETLGVQPPVRQGQTLRSRRSDGFCFGCDLSCMEKLERCSAD